MKQIIVVPPRQRVLLNEVETKLQDARRSNDYLLVNFGRKGEYIKISFHKDQTYNIGYNFWNMEFMVKTNIMLRQYKVTVNRVLAAWLFNWVNILNR